MKEFSLGETPCILIQNALFVIVYVLGKHMSIYTKLKVHIDCLDEAN